MQDSIPRAVITLSVVYMFSLITGLNKLLRIGVFKLIQSSIFWRLYSRWSRIYYAPLPLKLYLFQLAFQGYLKVEEKVGGRVREWMVEREGEGVEKGVRKWMEKFGEEEGGGRERGGRE